MNGGVCLGVFSADGTDATGFRFEEAFCFDRYTYIRFLQFVTSPVSLSICFHVEEQTRFRPALGLIMVA